RGGGGRRGRVRRPPVRQGLRGGGRRGGRACGEAAVGVAGLAGWRPSVRSSSAKWWESGRLTTALQKSAPGGGRRRPVMADGARRCPVAADGPRWREVARLRRPQRRVALSIHSRDALM